MVWYYSSSITLPPTHFFVSQTFVFSIDYYCYNLAVTLIWKAIPLLDESERFSVKLPNALNFSFSFAWYLRVYLVFLVIGEYALIKFQWQCTEKPYFDEEFELVHQDWFNCNYFQRLIVFFLQVAVTWWDTCMPYDNEDMAGRKQKQNSNLLRE